MREKRISPKVKKEHLSMIGNRAFKSFNILLSMVLFFSIVSPLFNVNAAEDNKRYIPAGIPIGLNVDFEGINVTGYGEIPGIKNKDNPAVKSGILPGDMIIAINGKKISTTSEFSQELKSSAGRVFLLRKHSFSNAACVRKEDFIS